MRIIIVLIFIIAVDRTAWGQYFQFSQYNFTDQRINPASVASSPNASVDIIYRSQSAAGDVKLKSAMVSATYPLISRQTGLPWSGIGVSVMDDRSGGIFQLQEASLSYAVRISLTRFQSLSLGMKSLFMQRSISMDGLFTGLQYVPDRGFDRFASNGENLATLRSSFVTFSAGMNWQQVDKKGKKIAHASISLFDFNKPEDSFYGFESSLHHTLVADVSIKAYEQDQFALLPQLLYTNSAGNHVLNAGLVTRYDLRHIASYPSHLDIITKYVAGRSGILGLQFHRENFSMGFSYDFPLFKKNIANTSAFEIGMEFRKLVNPPLKNRVAARKKAKVKTNTTARTSTTKVVSDKKPVLKNDSSIVSRDHVKVGVAAKEKLSETLRIKRDSVIAKADAGSITHQPYEIEKVVLHFNFEFNSSELDGESTNYLDDLVTALNENAHLRIKLTGHTDNIGSEKFNERLSLHRANCIKQYLTARGVFSDRIEVLGKGMREPLNENKTDEQRAKNRRVELTILYAE
jgi:type IX secretion system PorP/SprF family membrane protein